MQVFRHVEANDSPEHARCNNLAFLQNGTPYHLSIYRYILEPFTKLIFLVEYPLMKQNKPGCCNTNALSDLSASLDLVQKFVQTEKDLPLKVGFTVLICLIYIYIENRLKEIFQITSAFSEISEKQKFLFKFTKVV
jgi:hypothetical protein